jgi:hypothetical protein
MELITLITKYGLLNPLTQMFYSIFIKKIDCWIACTIANDYYIHYLSEKSKTCKLRTDNRKLNQVIT